MQELQKKTVYIQNPATVEEKIRQIVADGPDKLQVIADFDRTLTRFECNGRTILTSHGILCHSTLLPASFREAARKLKDRYFPLETSNDISAEERYKYMVEWWSGTNSLLVDCRVYRGDIKRMVADSGVMLREGVSQTFRRCHDAGVPFLIFSGGMGDILTEVIHQFAQLLPNMHVVSNFMVFDKEEKLIGFKGDIIHTCNKHEVARHHPDYFANNKSRTNVILLGDMLGDLRMAEGFPGAKNILTVGYLNDNIEASLESYMANFDIVLVSDETFDVVNALLQKIH
ncbi:cytosolic 5'-nucleotidase 3-like [Diadema antillarum]|uniref:cytosolic 5'-nucleotidase 3-like n=1 Tax=Diadema antillarum TaxID=105358 RepID=UPI003A8BFCB0